MSIKTKALLNDKLMLLTGSMENAESLTEELGNAEGFDLEPPYVDCCFYMYPGHGEKRMSYAIRLSLDTLMNEKGCMELFFSPGIEMMMEEHQNSIPRH
jgi:hypothetical protein